MQSEHTTAAVLTPHGSGAIGIIRVAGPNALHIVSGLFQSKDGRPLDALLAARTDRLCYGRLVDGDDILDDVIISLAPALPPAVDICAHGGVRLLERILESLERRGARVGRGLDALHDVWLSSNRISQEAVEALVQAKTARAARFLAWQQTHLPQHLMALAADCETNLDRVRAALGDLLDGASLTTAKPRLGSATEPCGAAALTLIDGATVAIVGPPNVGKSTLFNRLVGRRSALVSPVAGTTRDWVTADIELAGIPITLVDTAGFREEADALEKTAIDAGAAVGSRADLRIIVLDGSEPQAEENTRWLAKPPDLATIVVLNKIDLNTGLQREPTPDFQGALFIRISAETGENMALLESAIQHALGFRDWQDFTPRFFTVRQIDTATAIRSDLSLSPMATESAIRDDLIGRQQH